MYTGLDHALDQRVRWFPVRLPRRVTFWGIGVVMLVITSLHYLTSAHLLPYHAIYRSLYYVPVGVAAVVWGVRGGMLTAVSVALLYLPHAFTVAMPPAGKFIDNLLEVISMTVMAMLVGALADRERRQRHQIDALRSYITDVLTSLPVGVATIEPPGGPVAQNPAARALLDELPLPDLPLDTGYREYLDGPRPVGIHRSPLHGADGIPVGHVLVMEDLREQRRLAEQVRQAERLAALGQLAGGLAHEVRNPLAIVRATAQILRRKLREQAEVADHVRIVLLEADRIDRLVGELLTYASPQAPQRTLVSIADVVGDLATAVASVALQHAVTLELDLPPALPAVLADAEHLRQALLNVVLNAIQASPPGHAVLLHGGVAAGRLVIHVDDRGAGIPAAIRHRVFDPFFTTRDEGTGMGLAVVARIVSEHEGTIAVQDRPGGGTRIAIQLPIAKEAL